MCIGLLGVSEYLILFIYLVLNMSYQVQIVRYWYVLQRAHTPDSVIIFTVHIIVKWCSYKYCTASTCTRSSENISACGHKLRIYIMQDILYWYCMLSDSSRFMGSRAIGIQNACSNSILPGKEQNHTILYVIHPPHHLLFYVVIPILLAADTLRGLILFAAGTLVLH